MILFRIPRGTSGSVLVRNRLKTRYPPIPITNPTVAPIIQGQHTFEFSSTNWGQDIIYILKRTPDGAIQRLYLTPNGIEFILMDRVFCQNLL